MRKFIERVVREWATPFGELKYFSEIECLKREAKGCYLDATYLPDHVDCGLQMYHILRPDLACAAIRFNEIMDELKELGEDVPAQRLPEL